MPDKPPLYFSTGIRIANILHARLRQKCSSLKYDLFRCNLIASCNCDCGNYIESVDNFFLKCNIYTEHRIQLFRGTSNFRIYYLEMPLLKTTKILNCSCSSKNTLLILKDLSSKFIYIEHTSDDNDLVYMFPYLCLKISIIQN
jgi:hypothetical protein